jgi:tetratricopeptide (TPR) repeat protein
VQALVHDGVPQATAEHLIAGLYTPPAAIRHLSDDYQSVLWVQMKTGTGIIGWTNDAGYPSFDGQYKLFTYILPETAAEQNGTWDYELGVQAEKPSSLRIGPTVIPVAANSFVKVHTGYVLHAGETQSIELVAKEDGELLAKTFVRPGTPVQNVSGSSATPAGQGPSKEGDRALGDLLGQARTLFENGQYELALVRCNALLDKYPRNAEATDLKSKIEKAISILGRSTQAVASLQKQDALSAPPDLLQQAQTLFERGQYSVALSRCNDLLAKYPGDQKAIDLKRKIQTAIDVLKQ